MQLVKNSEHTVTIESYNSSGYGVTRIDGHVIFVKGVLRGELCTIRILKVLRTVAYAKPINILTPSPHRITPSCGSFGKCGGCDFLHMTYTEELVQKRLRVQDAITRIGGFELDIPPVIGSPAQTEYRNKVIYAVGTIDGQAAAGFYRERSHDIVTADECQIQTEVSHRACDAVLRWMDFYSVPAYDEISHSGAIRHVFCRAAFSTGAAQVTVVTAESKLPRPDALVDEIRKSCPEIVSIILNVNKNRGNTVLLGNFRVLWGEDHITDELCSLKFRLSPRSFYQINRSQAEQLYYKAAELAELSNTQTALDLYCGTGTITLLLARYAGTVIGAEIVPEAIEDARKNAELNGVTNARFICADAAQAADTLKKSGIRPDVIVVDPPRKGLSPDVIASIAEMCPERVVYVSCDPATLARDLKLLSELGFPPVSVTPFDMFPRCAHVECAALAVRTRKKY